MSKFFTQNLSTRAQRGRLEKKEAAKAAPPEAPNTPPGPPPPQPIPTLAQERQTPPDAVSASPVPSCEIYDDTTVCRILRIRRNVVAAARTKRSRGEDWDAVGMHVGMTRKWIASWACQHGFVPRFDDAEPIREGDGIVSCVLIQPWRNPSFAVVEIVATGERETARVRDMTQFPMRARQAFDCMRTVGGRLEWTGRPNAAEW